MHTHAYEEGSEGDMCSGHAHVHDKHIHTYNAHIHICEHQAGCGALWNLRGTCTAVTHVYTTNWSNFAYVSVSRCLQ